jgi:hypothetical protein
LGGLGHGPHLERKVGQAPRQDHQCHQDAGELTVKAESKQVGHGGELMASGEPEQRHQQNGRERKGERDAYVDRDKDKP